MFATLRSLTRELHDKAEAPFVSLTGATPELATYVRFLGVMHAFTSAVEPLLEDVRGFGELSPSIDRPRRARRHLAAADLRALGVELPCATFPRLAISDLASAIGAAYVIDGSSLGGRVLYRNLAQRLPDARHALSFLEGHGDAVGPMWRELTLAADAFATNGERRAAIERSAVTTFGAFVDHVSRVAATG